jgi:hypothetical protein
VAWIKIEHTMPDKPEVAAMAERLGIDMDSIAGKLLRLWIWCDQQTTDGNAPRITASFIDRLTNCPGFTAALIEAGWLIERKGALSIPNFARHNGQTAKTRALTSDRVKRSRNAPTVTEPLTALILSPSFSSSDSLLKAVQDWQRYFPSAKDGRTFDQVQLDCVLMEAQRKGWDANKLERCIRFSIGKGFKSICDPDERPDGNGSAPLAAIPKLSEVRKQ